MKGFLEEVALDLYRRYGERLGECSMLFPSRRARLFFVDALSRITDRPIWQPRWTSIDQLMSEISGLTVGDRMRLITELYKVYSKYHDEAFDKFYFWGDMLLTDFDMIDKYRIDADMLFRNIEDIKEIEADISYLTPEQLQILSFWSSFGAESDFSEEKRKFLGIWKTLGRIYHEYRERLTGLGMAYNGMVQRAAADLLSEDAFEFETPRRFIVAGFNALSECEKQLFRFLSTHAETDFYWDYDTYYKDNREQEAGMFVRQNVVEFPPCCTITHDHMAEPKAVASVAAVSNAVQCKYAAEILRKLSEREPLDKRTAVVLTDENLLVPLLYALPPELGEVNVTMGYPLRTTMAYTFIERLIELQHHCRRTKNGQTTFYHVDVTGLLSHPYIQETESDSVRELQEQILRERRISVDATLLHRSNLLRAVFTPAESWSELSDYLVATLKTVAACPCQAEDRDQRLEFLSVTAEEITKLHNSLNDCDVELTTSIYTSLLRRHLQTVRIPFEGEPLKGIQVMGILETRSLDFKNVIILSMTDDNFPGNRLAQSSFIPYNLRAAYALPTPEHHEGVFAYYFYRLIQRAERVYMLYCSHADDKSTGEPSRYIRQLDYESGFDIRKLEVGVDVNLVQVEPISVAKGEREMKRLDLLCDSAAPERLSPTLFSQYVACPLKFYFKYVARLRTDDEMAEEVDAPMFGTILHAAAQKLYERIRGEHHPGQTLRALMKTDAVAEAVAESINENYLCDPNATKEEYTGNLLLVNDIVIRYLKRGVMSYDAAHDDFTVEGLEQPVGCNLEVDTPSGHRVVKFGGIADRIDMMDDGRLRVVDYKTSHPVLDFKSLELLFKGKNEDRQAYAIQTLLYSMMLYRARGTDVVPTLYYVREMGREDYRPTLYDSSVKTAGLSYAYYSDAFEELLRETLAELFDPSTPFKQCEDVRACDYCDFKQICKR